MNNPGQGYKARGTPGRSEVSHISPIHGMGSRSTGSPFHGRQTPGRSDFEDRSNYSHMSTTSKMKSDNSLYAMFSSCFTSTNRKSSATDLSLHRDKNREDGSKSSRSKCSSRTLHITAQDSDGKIIGGRKFTLAGIRKATGDFSPSAKIGQGGFGTVYKGKLDDGTIVAIKRARKNAQDKTLGKEFQNEIRTLTGIRHLNLVSFLGYLEGGGERILISEYVPNGTLREHLDCKFGIPLSFGSRLDIAIDVAHAITYLHTYIDRPIIHRDIKSSNILLTENLRAKVADFGFARLASDDAENTHISTQVKGTVGYLDPEYMSTFQLTDKSDVYSFGALLVELISGRRAFERTKESKERVSVKWAMKKYHDCQSVQILDPMLSHIPTNNMMANTRILEQVLELAHDCLAPYRGGRPSMEKCAKVLWNIRSNFRQLVSSGSHITSTDFPGTPT